MLGDSRLNFLHGLLEHQLEGALVADEQGHVLAHNSALNRLLEISDNVRIHSLLRVGRVNLQRLLLRAAISAGEQDAVGRPSFRPLDFIVSLDALERPRKFRIRSTTLSDGEDNQRLRLITLHPFSPGARFDREPAGAPPLADAEIPFTHEPTVQKRIELALKAVHGGIPLLLHGESGTGKSLCARWLQQKGPRSAGPVRRLFCGVLPDTAVTSELLGYQRGAFPGAVADRAGLIETIHRGTLILEGLDQASARLQTTLQRVLEDTQLERLGDSVPATRNADIHVISTCREDPDAYLASGQLQPESYHRLAGTVIELPPLRERPRDLSAALQVWSNKNLRKFSNAALSFLSSHTWPGNFWELQHFFGVLKYATADDQDIDLAVVRELIHLSPVEPGSRVTIEHNHSATEAIPAFTDEEWEERERLHTALAQHSGNRTLAAKSLGMDRTTLWRKLHRLRLIQEPGSK